MMAAAADFECGGERRASARLMSLLLCCLLCAAAGVVSAEAPAVPDSTGEAGPKTERLPDGRLRLGPLLLDEREGTLDVPARINMNQGMIEVLACSEWGKRHESLLVLEAEPYLVQVGLLLLFGLPPKAVGVVTERSDPASYVPRGPRLGLRVLWPDGDGRERALPVESWICLAKTAQPIEEIAWAFTGSILGPAGFAAQTIGTIVATYTDQTAIVDNPRPEGRNDESYWICPDGVPPVGSRGVLRFVRSRSVSAEDSLSGGRQE
jgi:hypothetical protein